MGRRAPGWAAVILVMTACTTGSPPTRPSPPAPTPQPRDSAAYVGAYRIEDGSTIVFNGHGYIVNLRDSSIRQLYPAAPIDNFTFGFGFQLPTPKQAAVAFEVAGDRAATLTETFKGRPPLKGTRLAFRETEVKVAAKDATLAGTVTEPLTPGPHPGIVIVHGSGPGPRIDYGIWVGLYASLGLTVLAYDKRGNGASTGTYPGEWPSDASLAVYADDAAAVAGFLAAWPGVDPRRVGFHGGSQGGWTVPLAIQRFPAAAFAVLASAPAVTVGQQVVWASYSNGSISLPSTPESEMQAAVRADHSQYDPRRALAAMTQPALWLNGALDRQVPTRVNAEILRSYERPQWDVEVMPGVDHGFFENPSGLFPDEAKADKLAVGAFQRIADWLAAHAGIPATSV